MSGRQAAEMEILQWLVEGDRRSNDRFDLDQFGLEWTETGGANDDSVSRAANPRWTSAAVWMVCASGSVTGAATLVGRRNMPLIAYRVGPYFIGVPAGRGQVRPACAPQRGHALGAKQVESAVAADLDPLIEMFAGARIGWPVVIDHDTCRDGPRKGESKPIVGQGTGLKNAAGLHDYSCGRNLITLASAFCVSSGTLSSPPASIRI